MRTLTIVLVFLFLSTAIVAQDKAVSSPKMPQVMARLVQNELYYGQKLEISYDKGKIWQQITWLDRQNCEPAVQTVSFDWSDDGWLMIVADKIPDDGKVSQRDFHDYLGVYDPLTKIIYWLVGYEKKYCQVASLKMDTVENAHWDGPNVISYKLIHLPMSEFAENQKKVVLTPDVLATLNQDLVPGIINFGYQLMAAKNQTEINNLIQQIDPATRLIAKKYFSDYLKYYALSKWSIHSSPLRIKNEIGVPFVLNDLTIYKKYKVAVPLFSLTYNITKKTYSFDFNPDE